MDRIPRILITIRTSRPVLSKSGKDKFAITLEATTDTSTSIIVDPFQTLLDPREALDYKGFTFKDTATGALTKRPVIDVLYQVPDYLTAKSTIEIPGVGTGRVCTMVYDFDVLEVAGGKDKILMAEQMGQQIEPNCPLAELLEKPGDVSFEENLRLQFSSVAGFEIGREYEIGLGVRMSSVNWWHPGSKRDVFSWWRQRRSRHTDCPKLEMVLMNRTVFKVVG